MIFSDDGGDSWLRGEVAVRTEGSWVHPSETVAEQLVDGRVVLNVRTESPANRRVIVYSRDGATQWTKPRLDEFLWEPVCMAGLIRHHPGNRGNPARLLFSNPHNLERSDGKSRPGGNRDRKNLTVKLSNDDGKTWPVSRSREPGASAYSDLAVLPNGDVLCLYERGKKGDIAKPDKVAALTVARFNLAWLTEITAPSKP